MTLTLIGRASNESSGYPTSILCEKIVCPTSCACQPTVWQLAKGNNLLGIKFFDNRSTGLLAIILIAGMFSHARGEIFFDADHHARERPSSIRFVSQDHSVSIRSDFRGGRLSRCVEIADDEFDLLVKPEREPINDSAWYAFQVYATKPMSIRIRLRYAGGTHRYRPLISRDKKTWQRIGKDRVTVHPQKTQAVFDLRIDDRPLWISAQELLTGDLISQWSESLLQLPFVTQQEIGRSVQNRPIHQLKISETTSPSYLFILGRQHPPEVSGTIGMMRFVEAITSQSKVARSFRKQFCTVVVPMSNPDGVARGYWRCNANGVDLNRDWGRFSQPETRAIGQSILDCRAAGRRSLYLLLDFHSTYEDVFYTAADVDDAFPAGFASSWLSAIDQRFPRYQVNHDATHNGNRTTSKAWAHETLGVAAVTYEFGDTTRRDRIEELARGSAEEMMRLLLDRVDQTKHATTLIKN